MDPKDKDGLMIAIGKIKPGDKSEKLSGKRSDAGFEAAFEDLADALGVDSGSVDVEKGVKALKNFFEQCSMSSEDYESEDSE